MAAKTATIKLGDVEYTISAFDIDQLQEFIDIPADTHWSFNVLKLALKNAEPPASGVIRADLIEVRTAVRMITELAGISAPENPPAAAPPAAS